MLQIQHLTKHYPGTDRGITDLTLSVEKGDLYAFIGQNGAGKTTTLKAVAGLHPFDAGEIFIDGISMREDPIACKRLMAYIPDHPDLYDYMTGMQYLTFIADVFQISDRDRTQRVREYAELFSITGALGDLIGTYSHGMKQKLAILGALIHDPRLLVLDEPFVGLDPEAIYAVKQIMRELCSRGGAVFFSTHVLEVAEKLCSKVAIIRDGRLVIDGPMSELRNRAGSLESVFLEVAGHEAADPS